MSFFTQDFLDFFSELSSNNNREWFQANKKRYEKSVKKPFYLFVEEMISRINAVNPDVAILAKDAVFRINRDIRFSTDKRPYKLHMAAVISREGRKNHQDPGLYFHLGAEQAYIGGGAYTVEKEALYNIRSTIAASPEQFSALIDAQDFRRTYYEIKGERNKILPKEFQAAAEKQPLLYNKQFYYMAGIAPGDILQPNLAERFMGYYLAALPVAEFLKKAMQA